MDLKSVIDAVSNFLAHPLVIVLIGGFVAAIVGQRLAVSWESRRSALDQKYKLIEDMTEELAKLFSSANLAETQRDSTNPQIVSGDLIEPILNWTIFSEVFGAKLRAYFPESSLAEKWATIYEAAYTFAHLSGLFDINLRQEHIDSLIELLELEESRFAIDFDLLANRQSVQPGGDLEVPFARSWRMIRLTIEERRDKLSHKILTNRSLIETVKPSILTR